MTDFEPRRVEILDVGQEPIWCCYCSRQAYYSVELAINYKGALLVCGRHILKAIRKG